MTPPWGFESTDFADPPAIAWSAGIARLQPRQTGTSGRVTQTTMNTRYGHEICWIQFPTACGDGKNLFLEGYPVASLLQTAVFKNG